MSDGKRRSESDVEQGEISALPSGRLRRAWRIAGIVNEGVGIGAIRRKARTMLGTESVRGKVVDELNRELGQNLARNMGEMKGLVMKAGQMLSYLDQQMPSPLRETLAQLQTRVRPVDTAKMKALFLESFGVPVEEAFAEFEEVPIAAASVGQVYRATLHDGRRVAVKIQYPEIVQVMENDLNNVSLMSQFGRMLNASVEDVIEEVREALSEELDYRIEAKNQEAFRAIFADDDLISIPKLVPEWCNKTILTTEFQDGVSFQEMLDTFSDEQKRDVHRAMGRFFYVAFYFYGMFNADPHPGNYLFTRNGPTTFLDFGCVRRFDRQFIDQQVEFVQSLRANDVNAIKVHAMRMGIVPAQNRDKVNWALLLKFFELAYRPIIRPGPFRFSNAYNKEVAEVTYELKKGSILHLRMPKQFVFLNRITFGLNALYAQLDMDTNYYDRASAMMDFYSEHLIGEPVPDPRQTHLDYHVIEQAYADAHG